MNLWGHKYLLHNNRHETKGRKGKFAYSRSQSVQSPLEMGKPEPEEIMVRTESWTWVSLQRRNLAWEDYGPGENPPPFLFFLCSSPHQSVHLQHLGPPHSAPTNCQRVHVSFFVLETSKSTNGNSQQFFTHRCTSHSCEEMFILLI